MDFKKYLTILIVGVLGCDKDYPNPDIQVELNKPFVLRNTRSASIPEGNVDTAVYTDAFDRFVFKLDTVVDFRCESCLEPQYDYYAGVFVNDSLVYLGEIRNSERGGPLNGAPLSLSTSLGEITLQLLSVERLEANDILNQYASYKKVTFILIR